MGDEHCMLNRNEEVFEDIHINEIKQEYMKIDRDWLLLHYNTSIGLVVFAFIVECIMGAFLINSDMMSTTVYIFIMKFMIIPSAINVILLLISTKVLHSKTLSQKKKIYLVSLIFSGICFVFFTVHNTFTAIYYIFSLAIMLTVIYANYRLTVTTALVSIAAVTISELFIVWDLDRTSVFDSTYRLSNFIIALLVLVAFSMACMIVIRFEQKKNKASIKIEIERKQLQDIVQIDELTGIFNRKALQAAFKNIEKNSLINHYILGIVDIDKFKGINDSWGHHVGDRCLIEFAKILKDNSAKVTPFRYGGDEFCLLFCNVSKKEAESICRNIQCELNQPYFQDCPDLKLTASFGLAENKGEDSGRLFIHADYALYEAKKTRNSICIFKEKDEN